MKREFSLRVGSDTDYEDLIADIYYGDQFIGVISQEKGFENLEIQLPIGILLPIKSHKELTTLNLQEFMNAIEMAKEKLWKLRRIE